MQAMQMDVWQIAEWHKIEAKPASSVLLQVWTLVPLCSTAKAAYRLHFAFAEMQASEWFDARSGQNPNDGVVAQGIVWYYAMVCRRCIKREDWNILKCLKSIEIPKVPMHRALPGFVFFFHGRRVLTSFQIIIPFLWHWNSMMHCLMLHFSLAR